jgi:hypothetical protein
MAFKTERKKKQETIEIPKWPWRALANVSIASFVFLLLGFEATLPANIHDTENK